MHRADVQSLAGGLVPASYLAHGARELRRRDEAVRSLLASRQLPAVGWPDAALEAFISSLAALDSNNGGGGGGGALGAAGPGAGPRARAR
jgi:hypothetical protein